MASGYHPVAEVFALLKGLEQGLGVCDYSKVEIFRRLQKKLSSSDFHPQSVYWKLLGSINEKPDWCTSRSVHSCSCRSGWPTCPLPLCSLWRSETHLASKTFFLFTLFLFDFEVEFEKCYQLRENPLACRRSSALWSSAFLQMPSTLSFWSP